MIGRDEAGTRWGGIASSRSAARSGSFHTVYNEIGSVLGFANNGARGRAPSHNLKPKT